MRRLGPLKILSSIVYELYVGTGDMGKVIGKIGQTAFAIRKLFSTATAKKKGLEAFWKSLNKYFTKQKSYNPNE